MSAFGFNSRVNPKRVYVRPSLTIDYHNHQSIDAENVVIKIDQTNLQEESMDDKDGGAPSEPYPISIRSKKQEKNRRCVIS